MSYTHSSVAVLFSLAAALASGAASPALAAAAGETPALAGGVSSGGAIENLPGEIVNGLDSFDRPSTVALIYGSGRELGCSGTLIGCQTVLTAAHCVEGESPREVFVYAQHAGVFAVSSIRLHPDYYWEDADVAVLKLATPVTGITPSPFNEVADPATRPGSPGTIVGFGISSGPALDAGLKRWGRVATAGCAASSEGELSDRNYVCWRYDRNVGAPGQDSNTCSGDSGGPLFLTLGGREVVAGVTSGGLVDDCGPGDVSFDANVFAYRSFVRRQLGRDATAACGGLPAVGTASTRVVGRSTRIGRGQEIRTTLQVGAGARELRVGLNAEDDGALEVDLYVRRGSSVSTTSFDCRQAETGNFALCRIPAPPAGTWSVLVRSRAGDGRYQLTATVFGATVSATAEDVGR